MAGLTTSCHCGEVRIEVSKSPRTLTACNCSVCRRYGALWAYFRPKDVRFLSPRRALEFYERGDRHLRFGRCRKCGCVTHWERRVKKRDGSGWMGINTRNVEEPEIVANLPIKMLDGAGNWKVLYERRQPALFRSPQPRRKAKAKTK